MSREYTGLKLPKESVYADSDGTYFVYISEAGENIPTPVDLIYCGEDFYLAAVSDSPDGLHEGSAVIISHPDIQKKGIPER